MNDFVQAPLILHTLLPFALSFFIVYVSTPVVIHIAERRNLLDKPDGERKKHRKAVPTLGGISIFSAFLISYTLFAGLSNNVSMPYIIAGVAILFFAGLKDDILILSPVKKLILQLCAAGIVVVLGGIYIPSLDGLFGITTVPFWISAPFSIFALVIILNAYNLIDGVDGLAGTVGFVASSAFGTWFAIHGLWAEALLSFAISGALLGFLYYNFEPAKIFMGDTGSMVIGFLLGILSFSMMSANTTLPIENQLASPAIVAFAILIIPMYDTVRVILVRLKKRISPLKADTNHIHHRLLRLGFRHRGIALTLGTINIIVIIVAFGADGVNPHTHMLINFLMPLLILPIMTYKYLYALKKSQKSVRISSLLEDSERNDEDVKQPVKLP